MLKFMKAPKYLNWKKSSQRCTSWRTVLIQLNKYIRKTLSVLNSLVFSLYIFDCFSSLYFFKIHSIIWINTINTVSKLLKPNKIHLSVKGCTADFCRFRVLLWKFSFQLASCALTFDSKHFIHFLQSFHFSKLLCFKLIGS